MWCEERRVFDPVGRLPFVGFVFLLFFEASALLVEAYRFAKPERTEGFDPVGGFPFGFCCCFFECFRSLIVASVMMYTSREGVDE